VPAVAREEDRPVGLHHHRDISGGAARAAVFGISDGLVSNVGLILGVAGADPAASVVRLAGLAGLIAGAVSMAAGEFNSMKVQAELLEWELDRERRSLERFPHAETVELTQIYQSKGVEADQARALAEAMMRDPDRALEAHALEELGVSPQSLGSPYAAALASLGAFSIGAVVPLLPWFVAGHTGAVVASLVLAVIAAVVVGASTGRFTGRSRWRTALRQVLFTIVPAAITYAIGYAVGVNV
jgi:VIT1/CCC1 family predicted Fe2+/Mn2+ transporter